MSVWPRNLMVGLMLLGAAACQTTKDKSNEWADPEIVDVIPQGASDGLKRLTAEQYNNTISDLFSVAGVEAVVFPFELDVDGFDNNTAVNNATPTLVETYFEAGFVVAETVARVADDILDCKPVTSDCAKAYLLETARRAWRRDLSSDELALLQSQFDEDARSFEWRGALELGLAYILQVPDFLYFPEFGFESGSTADGTRIELNSYEVAARLSYLIWNSTPDERLLELAKEDKLRDRQEVIQQAWRMLGDLKAQRGVLGFYKQLLELDKIGTTSLDFSVYLTHLEGDGGSDYLHQILQPAMRFEPEILVVDEVFRGSGQLSGLLTANHSYVSESLAELYGVEIDENSEAVYWQSQFSDTVTNYHENTFYKTELDPTQRSGVLTMLGFLNSHAKLTHPSPVLRGVFVQERFLCTPPPPPPGDVPALEDTNNGQAPRTNRERYANHTENPACFSCHEGIDGIGFTFENYDALGMWRDTDNGYPVDATGKLINTDVDGPVQNAVAMTQALAQSQTVHNCHVKQWFRYAFGRSETYLDRPYLDFVSEGFWASGGDIAELIVNIAGSKSFLTRKVPQ